MANSLSTAFVAEFSSQVKQAYQHGSILKGTIRTVSGVKASTYRFPKLGKSEAVPRGTASSTIAAAGFTHSNATATISDFVLGEYTDIFGQQKVNFDEKSELAKAIGMGLGRKLDGIIIGAMDSRVSTITAANKVGSTTSSDGLTLAKIVKAAALLNDKGVGMDGRTLAITATALEQAMSVKEITSTDYASMKALMSGEVNTFMGFMWKMIEARSANGLTIASNVAQCFAYHKDAVGLAMGMEPKTEVNYIPEQVSWLTTGLLAAGAVGIDDDGIVPLYVDHVLT